MRLARLDPCLLARGLRHRAGTAPHPVPETTLEALAKNAPPRSPPTRRRATNISARASSPSRNGWRRPTACAARASTTMPPSSTGAWSGTIRATSAPPPAWPKSRATRRHDALMAEAEKLVKAERFADAQEALRPVLAENPRHADARRMQRLIEERTIKAALPRLRAAKPMSLDLRDVPVRSVFDVIGRTAEHQLRLRPRRAPRPAHQRHGARPAGRGPDPPGAHHQPARAARDQRDHRAGLPEYAGQAARVPGAGGEGVLHRQRRRQADRQHAARCCSRCATCSSTRSSAWW